MSTLEIKDLHVTVETEQGTKEILRGVTLTINSGETHAIMGPNGSGKSTLAYSVAGHPKYTITSGTVTLDGEDVLAMSVDERARAGLFLAMQYPVEVPGVTVSNFLRTAKTAIDGEAPKAPHVGQGPQAVDERPQDGPGGLRARGQRGLLRWREEASRDPPDGASSSPRSRSSTRPTPASTSTRSASSPRASTAPRSPPAPVSCSSRTTRGSCATSSRTSSTSSWTVASPRRVAPSLADRLEAEGYDRFQPVSTPEATTAAHA